MSMLNEKPDPIFLSGNIRLLRKNLSLSQEELAHRVGLNRGNIASYEKGTAEPKICNLLKFAQVFRVSLLDLTRKDLAESPGLPERIEVTSTIPRPEGLDKHQNEIDEILTVVNSLYNCHQFHVKNQENMSKEMQTTAMHFEQLYELTQTVLLKHEQLLKYFSTSREA